MLQSARPLSDRGQGYGALSENVLVRTLEFETRIAARRIALRRCHRVFDLAQPLA